MGQPITWQTIRSQNLADAAARPMEQAQRSFNAAFAGIGDIFKQQEAIEADNLKVNKDLNTQRFLSSLSETFKTPEELQAGIASGAVAKLKASFGPNIDEAAVRGAAENLLTQRYQQATLANTYGDQQLDRTWRNKRDWVASEIASRDPKRVAAAKAYLDSVEMPNEAPLHLGIDEAGQVVIQRGREDVRFKQQNTLFNDQMTTNAAQRAAAEASRKTAGIQQEIAQDALKSKQEAAQYARIAAKAAAAREALRATGNPYADGVYSPANAPELMELMTKNGIGHTPAERQAIIDRFSSSNEVEVEGSDGTKIKMPIPLSLLKAKILGSDDEWFNMYNQGWANDVENRLREALAAEVTVGDGAQKRKVNPTIDHYRAFKEVMANIREAPQLVPPKRR